MKLLRAVNIDLCQADEDEVLVPNPIILPNQDNDYFVGVHSRRPARYGRVAVSEDETLERIIAADQGSTSGPADEVDEERTDDVRFLIDSIADFEVGSLVSCRYTMEDDELSWEIYEIEEEMFAS